MKNTHILLGKTQTLILKPKVTIMEILGITEENKDLDMILIIEKEGMKYFFDRFDKISREEHPDEYKYFSQYLNMYLFDSDMWEIEMEEQFKNLGINTLDDTNIRTVLDMIFPTNINQFWENLLPHLDLIKMSKFLDVEGVHEHYVNHSLWDVVDGKPLNTLLLSKFLENMEFADNVYHIIYTILKKKKSNSKKKMINWIIDVCKSVEIPIKPVISLENIIEVVQFTRERGKRQQEKYNKETILCFNLLKIFLKLFENGISSFDDLSKVKYEYLSDEPDSEQPKESNFLTTMFFNLQTLIDKCYLFKIAEIKQRDNYINQMEDEIDHICEVYPGGLSPETSRLLSVLRETVELEKSRKEFLKKEISFRKNCRIGEFYIMSSYWIVKNIDIIEKNKVNDIIGNILLFFLTEKITNNELFEFEKYTLTYVFNLAIKILHNEDLTSDPSHKMDAVYIIYKNFNTNHYNTFNKFFGDNIDIIYRSLVDTSIFLKDKLDDYGESYKLHIFNMIFTMMDYTHYTFKIHTIDNKDTYKKYLGILIENINCALEFWVNSVKHIKKIQDEDKDLSSDEIESFRRSLETAGIYLQNGMKILAEVSPHNFDLIISDEIVKKFSNSMAYILETLVGGRRKELALKDKEMFGFYPLTYLKISSDIIGCFACCGKFINSMGTNGTYNVSVLVRKMADILGKKGALYHMRGEVLRQFIEKVGRVQDLETARDEIEIPDEFCDPIMQTLIETPVILPETDIFMDREVICRHLLTEETNPFNREQLSIEKLDEYNSQENIKTRIGEFKEKVEAWKREAKF